MEKEQIFAFIEGQIATGKISKEDLLKIAGAEQVSTNVVSKESHKEQSSKNLISVFYVIGVIIVLAGVGTLIGQNWEVIGFAGRILVSLGIALIAYIYAFSLNKPENRVLSQVMFTVSAALAPLGSAVLLNQANISFDWVAQFYTAISLAVIFGYALWARRKNILILITVAFGTWAYYSVLLNIFTFNYSFDFIKWAVMLMGFAYILIGYGMGPAVQLANDSDTKEKNVVRNIFYRLGALSVLGAGISIGGYFDILFIAFIFATFYGSVYLKSQSMLALGALFLMAHIVKLTSKYFVDSIGWPVSLIIVGFLIIGVGYMTYSLNKKYISAR